MRETSRLGGRLVAVFVSHTPSLPASLDGAAALAISYQLGDEAATETAEKLLGQLQGLAAELSVDLTFLHARGDATTELLRVAAEQHADEIVVGKSTKVFHHLAGSAGRRLIGSRESPVVVVVP